VLSKEKKKREKERERDNTCHRLDSLGSRFWDADWFKGREGKGRETRPDRSRVGLQ
jgi:hypothetical protein